MVDRRFLVSFTAALLAVSGATYVIHYWLFEDLHHILIFFVEDIAFIPIEVLLATLVIHRLLESRAAAERREKLGMLIGAFFSTVGIDLLAALAGADPDLDAVRAGIRREAGWKPADLPELRRLLGGRAYRVAPGVVDLPRVKALLASRQDFLLRLLENPALLEHESFSELLRAIFHAAEEPDRRPDLAALPSSDRHHLAVDLDRVYPMLAREWLDYLEYVGRHYPYLFSLAVRTSPFDPEASVVVRDGT
jgi:hypothetical protein